MWHNIKNYAKPHRNPSLEKPQSETRDGRETRDGAFFGAFFSKHCFLLIKHTARPTKQPFSSRLLFAANPPAPRSCPQRGPDCHSAAVSAAVRQQFGSNSAAAPQLLCITSAAALQLFFITSAVVPQHLAAAQGHHHRALFSYQAQWKKKNPQQHEADTSIGIGGCRREVRALLVVPPSRRPLRSNNRRQQRRRRRRSCFLRARRGGGGVLSWISQLTRTDSSHYLSWRM